MAATAAEIRERDLLSRLAAGTAGVVGAAFLRRLVAELAGALDAEVAFVAELSEQRPGYARTIASRLRGRDGAARGLRVRARRHAVRARLRAPTLLLVRRGARAALPGRRSSCARTASTATSRSPLRGADGRAIGHIGVISTRPARPGAERAAGAAGLRRPRRRRARAPPPRARAAPARRRGRWPRAPAPCTPPTRSAAASAATCTTARSSGSSCSARRSTWRCASSSATRSRRRSAARPRRASRPRWPAASCASWPAACTRSGSSAACAARSPRSPPSRRSRCTSTRCPSAGCPPVVETHDLVPRLRGALQRDQARRARPTLRGRASSLHGRTLVATVADDGARRRLRRPAAPGCRASPRGSSRSAAGWTSRAPSARARRSRPRSRSPPGAPPPSRSSSSATTATAAAGCARSRSCWPATRTTRRLAGARVGARGRPAADRPAPAGLRPHRPPPRRRRGRARRGAAVRRDRPARRSTPSRARPTGTPPARAAYDECREEIAALLGEPDWRLTDAEPMVILTYRSVPGGGDQRLDPVGDLARHRDRARRALDGAGVQHRVDDVLQVRVVARHDAAQQVAVARHAVDLEHLGHARQRRDGLLEAPLDDLQRDEGEHRIAHLRGLDLRPEAGDHAARGELVHPRLHGAAGDAEPPRDLHDADARVRAQHQQQARVEPIDLLGHVPKTKAWRGRWPAAGP